MSDSTLILIKDKIIHTDSVIKLLSDKNTKIIQLREKLKFLYHKYLEKTKEAETCKFEHEPLTSDYKNLLEKYNDLDITHRNFVNNSEIKYQNVCQELEDSLNKNKKTIQKLVKCNKCEEELEKNRVLRKEITVLKHYVKKLLIKEEKIENSLNALKTDSGYTTLKDQHIIELENLKSEHHMQLKNVGMKLKSEINESQHKVISLEAQVLLLKEKNARLTLELANANQYFQVKTQQREVEKVEHRLQGNLHQLLNECAISQIPNLGLNNGNLKKTLDKCLQTDICYLNIPNIPTNTSLVNLQNYHDNVKNIFGEEIDNLSDTQNILSDDEDFLGFESSGNISKLTYISALPKNEILPRKDFDKKQNELIDESILNIPNTPENNDCSLEEKVLMIEKKLTKNLHNADVGQDSNITNIQEERFEMIEVDLKDNIDIAKCINEMKNYPRLLSPFSNYDNDETKSIIERTEDISHAMETTSMKQQGDSWKAIDSRLKIRRLNQKCRKRLINNIKKDIFRSLVKYVSQLIKKRSQTPININGNVNVKMKNMSQKFRTMRKTQMLRWTQLRELCLSNTDSDQDTTKHRSRRGYRKHNRQHIDLEKEYLESKEDFRKLNLKFKSMTEFYNSLSDGENVDFEDPKSIVQSDILYESCFSSQDSGFGKSDSDHKDKKMIEEATVKQTVPKANIESFDNWKGVSKKIKSKAHEGGKIKKKRQVMVTKFRNVSAIIATDKISKKKNIDRTEKIVKNMVCVEKLNLPKIHMDLNDKEHIVFSNQISSESITEQSQEIFDNNIFTTSKVVSAIKQDHSQLSVDISSLGGNQNNKKESKSEIGEIKHRKEIEVTKVQDIKERHNVTKGLFDRKSANTESIYKKNENVEKTTAVLEKITPSGIKQSNKYTEESIDHIVNLNVPNEDVSENHNKNKSITQEVEMEHSQSIIVIKAPQSIKEQPDITEKVFNRNSSKISITSEISTNEDDKNVQKENIGEEEYKFTAYFNEQINIFPIKETENEQKVEKLIRKGKNKKVELMKTANEEEQCAIMTSRKEINETVQTKLVEEIPQARVDNIKSSAIHDNSCTSLNQILLNDENVYDVKYLENKRVKGMMKCKSDQLTKVEQNMNKSVTDEILGLMEMEMSISECNILESNLFASECLETPLKRSVRIAHCPKRNTHVTENKNDSKQIIITTLKRKFQDSENVSRSKKMECNINKNDVICNKDENSISNEVKCKNITSSSKKIKLENSIEECHTNTEMIQDVIKNQATRKLKKSTFKRPNTRRRSLESPMSPPPVMQTDNFLSTSKIIPLEPIPQLHHAVAKALLKKLIQFPNESAVLQEVIEKFSNQKKVYVIRVILEEISRDDGTPDILYTPPAPVMTVVQRTFLGLLAKLQEIFPNLIKDVLLAVEQHILTQSTLQSIHPLTRFYIAICKLRKELYRMRRMVGDVFYSIGDLSIPFLFTVLSTWTDVFPLESETSDNPLVKVLIQVINLKTCSKRGYNLIPLKKLLETYYGYPTERWSSDVVFKDIFEKFRESPTKYLEYCLLILCKNHPKTWICQQVTTHLKPILDKSNEDYLQISVLSLLQNILIPLANDKLTCIVEIRTWLKNLLT